MQTSERIGSPPEKSLIHTQSIMRTKYGLVSRRDKAGVKTWTSESYKTLKV